MTRAERLAEAEAARHALVTGKAATVFVDQNGERVEYARVSLPALQAYIRDLRELSGEAARRPHTLRFQTSKGV